nr:copia protein [Tanacetum cinerariifolium]
MDMTIDQQVALDKAIVLHASRLRIGKSNFHLKSDISSKESTLQLAYDVLRLTLFYKAFLVTRSFAAIINKCLSGKSTSYDSLRLSQARILWRLYHKRNVDFSYLLWEEFVYQVEHKDAKKSNEMYYPRDDQMFTTIKLASRHQNTQQLGTMLPIELTNADIRNSEAYKEYYAVATGATPPKTKASVRKTKSSSDTTVTPPSTTATGTRLLSIHDEEETKDEESFDPIAKTPENTDDEGNGEENSGLNVGREEGQDEEDDKDELYRDVNINLEGRVVQMVDVQTTQEFEDSHVTLTLVNPDGVDSIFETTSQMDVQALTIVSPLSLSALTLTPSTIATISTVPQAPTPPTTALSTLLAVSSIPGIVQRYMNQRMNEAVKVAVQIQSDRLRNEAQAKNEEFLKNLDENIKKIIKEQVKEQILIEKIEGNKSIHRSNEQRNLYKALVEAYESDKIILDTYGGTITLKRRRDDDADKDEEPSAGSDRGSKRRRERKEPESASAPKEKATRTTGKSTQGSKSQQTSANEFATTEEPIQTDSRSSFNELMDTHVDFLAFLINRLKVDTLTPELLAVPTYELMKRSCKSLVELEFFLKEVYKATTDQLDWINLEGQQYSHNLIKPLSLILNSRGRHVIPFDHFINNDLENLRGGDLSRKYTTFVTKTKAADYGHIKESAHDVYSKRRIIAVTELKIVEWHNYKQIGSRHVKDLQLGVESYQKKFNLTRSDTYRSDLNRKEAYTAYSNPRGFIYQNKDKQNRLMWIDELHKFSDGTLSDFGTALDDRLKAKDEEDHEKLREEGSTQGYPLVSVEVLRKLKDRGEGTCFQLCQRFITTCSYPTVKYKDIMKAQVHVSRLSLSDTDVNAASASRTFSPPHDPLMPELEDTTKIQRTGIFGNAYDKDNLETNNYYYADESVGAEVDFNNMEPSTVVSPIPTTRVHSIHPKAQIIGDPKSAVQTREAIGTKWVYRNKKDKRGIIVRNRARLVAQGHKQEEGIDYDEVFAPVARVEAIRLFLAFASFMNFLVYHTDVKSSFLYGTIEEAVYVSQPLGFMDPEFPKKVYKVEKALYGLHQAPRAWYETLSTYLLDNRFHRGQIDKTLFIKRFKGDILLVQISNEFNGRTYFLLEFTSQAERRWNLYYSRQTLIKMKAEKAKLVDEQMAKRLHDEEVEKAAAREKQEKDDLERAQVLQKQYDDKEENIDWNAIAEKIQEKHLDNIRKYQNLKRKPVSIAQARKNMIIYLKNMAGYKMEHFRERPQMKRVAEETLLQESFNKLKAVEVSGSEFTQEIPTNDPKEISEEDVQNMLEIVPMSEFKVKALQVKYPIIDWEIHSEGLKTYWKIIRVGGITKAYQSFEDMLKGFDREDLVALWSLVKEKFSSAVPSIDKEKALWVELKRLFEPDADDVLWKLQRHNMFMLREKDYPLSNGVMTLMLNAKLQVEEDSEMARDLVMKIFMEANKPKSRISPSSSVGSSSPVRSITPLPDYPFGESIYAESDNSLWIIPRPLGSKPVPEEPNEMPPKRTSTSAAPAMTQAAIKKLVADSVSVTVEAQAANMAYTDNTIRPRETPVARKCTYKEFMSCRPFYFNGIEGAVGLIH